MTYLELFRTTKAANKNSFLSFQLSFSKFRTFEYTFHMFAFNMVMSLSDDCNVSVFVWRMGIFECPLYGASCFPAAWKKFIDFSVSTLSITNISYHPTC